MRRKLWKLLGRRRGLLGEYAPARAMCYSQSHHSRIELMNRGRYSDKKDVDLFEIDTVGDVEGEPLVMITLCSH